MRAGGNELAARLTQTVRALDLDSRGLPMDRATTKKPIWHAAAWYQVMARNSYGFTYTPLYLATMEDPVGFTLERLLELPHQDMVDDVVHQLYLATTSPLGTLRARTRAEDCTGGRTFPGAQITADADLAVDGLLVDYKSTKHPFARRVQGDREPAPRLPPPRHRRPLPRRHPRPLPHPLRRLATWPVEDYLDLLGTCRRNLTDRRAVTADLLTNCQADAIPYEPDEESKVRQLLDRLAPVIETGHCPVCAQPLRDSTGRPRTYCTRWCAQRSPPCGGGRAQPPGHRPGDPAMRRAVPDVLRLTCRVAQSPCPGRSGLVGPGGTAEPGGLSVSRRGPVRFRHCRGPVALLSTGRA
ncbi:hypothetical protein ACWGRF_08315 [Streptomyces zhihengii]